MQDAGSLKHVKKQHVKRQRHAKGLPADRIEAEEYEYSYGQSPILIREYIMAADTVADVVAVYALFRGSYHGGLFFEAIHQT